MKKSISLAGLMLILPLSVSGMEDSVGEKNTPTASESSQNQNDNLIDPDRVLQLLKDAQENQIPEILGSLDRSKLEEPIDDFCLKVFDLCTHDNGFKYYSEIQYQEAVADWILNDRKNSKDTIDPELVVRILESTSDSQAFRIISRLDHSKLKKSRTSIIDFGLKILWCRSCQDKNWMIDWILKENGSKLIYPDRVWKLLEYATSSQASEILRLLDRSHFMKEERFYDFYHRPEGIRLDDFYKSILWWCNDAIRKEIADWILKDIGGKKISPELASSLIYTQENKDQVLDILSLLDRNSFTGYGSPGKFCSKIARECYDSSDRRLGKVRENPEGKKDKLNTVIDWFLKDNEVKKIDPKYAFWLLAAVNFERFPEIFGLLDHDKLEGSIDDYLKRVLEVTCTSIQNRKGIVNWILKDKKDNGRRISPNLVPQLLIYAQENKNQFFDILDLLDRDELNEPIDDFCLKLFNFKLDGFGLSDAEKIQYREEVADWILKDKKDNGRRISPNLVPHLLIYAQENKNQFFDILDLLDRDELKTQEQLDDFCLKLFNFKLGGFGLSDAEKIQYREEVADWILKDRKNSKDTIDSEVVKQILEYTEDSSACEILSRLDREKFKTQEQRDKVYGDIVAWRCNDQIGEAVVNWILNDKKNRGEKITPQLVIRLLSPAKKNQVSEIFGSLDYDKLNDESIDDFYDDLLMFYAEGMDTLREDASDAEIQRKVEKVAKSEAIIDWFLKDNGNRKIAPNIAWFLVLEGKKELVSKVLDLLNYDKLDYYESIDSFYLHVFEELGYSHRKSNKNGEEIANWVLNDKIKRREKIAPELAEELLKYLPENRKAEVQSHNKGLEEL